MLYKSGHMVVTSELKGRAMARENRPAYVALISCRMNRI